MTQHSDWLLSDLCATLHALSADAPTALASQNPDLRRPEQLALKFGEAVLAAVSSDPAALTADQVQLLNELAVLLRDMSQQHEVVWSEAAVHSHPAWQQVRVLAAAALKQLGPQPPVSKTLH